MEDAAISYGYGSGVDAIDLDLELSFVFVEDHCLFAVDVSEDVVERVLELN